MRTPNVSGDTPPRSASHPWRAELLYAATPLLHVPYRSEAFAEDLVQPPAPRPMPQPKARRALLLFAVPLGAALLGGMLPILNLVA